MDSSSSTPAAETVIKLPGISRRGDYLYVVEFNSGTVKVGRTRHPETRLKNHATTGRPHGITVVAQWVSQPHRLARANESELIRFCAERYRSLNGGEFFAGACTNEIVRFAQSLATSPGVDEPLRFVRFGRLAGRGGRWPDSEPVVVLSLPPEMLAAIDVARGSATREDWLREAARLRLGEQ